MRDLKYLIEFEDLLQEANNALVRQAKGEGRLALGYTCYFMPEAVNDYMFTVMHEEPLDPSLLEIDDSRGW